MGKRKSRRTVTREQAAWYDMVYRCTRPDHARYKDYGARGIKVYPQWLGPEGRQIFTEYMGPKPAKCILGRLDMTGNYEPENVAWMTRSEARRRQCNTVRIDTPNGAVPIVDIAEEVGVDPRKARRRVAWNGWSPEEALSPGLSRFRRMTEEQALEVCQRVLAGETCTKVASDYGVSVTFVSCIARGKKWARVTAHLREQHAERDAKETGQ